MEFINKKEEKCKKHKKKKANFRNKKQKIEKLIDKILNYCDNNRKENDKNYKLYILTKLNSERKLKRKYKLSKKKEMEKREKV